MPAKYGAITKAYIENDAQLRNLAGDRLPNNNSMNLYVLSYDANRNFVACNDAIKENLRNYLKEYRLLTDAINIRDPFIIDISVDVDIIPYADENSNEVILRCLDVMIDYFDPDKISINQPIIISNLRSALDRVSGVMTVVNIDFGCIIGTGYSNNWYDLEVAERNGIIYPPQTISIFQVRNRLRDLRCRVVEG